MKAFWIMGFVMALSGCAAPPVTTSFAPITDPITPGVTLASAQGCATWRVLDGLAVCKADVAAVQSAGAREVPALGMERPQEIVGHEAHHAVLDGAS